MLKKILSGFILISIVALFYFAWLIDYKNIQNVQLVFLVAIALFHFFAQENKSSLFLSIIGCFILSAIIAVYNNLSQPINQNLVLIANILSFSGYLLLLIHIIKEQKFQFKISNRFLYVLLLMGLNIFVIYYYFNLMQNNKVDILHSGLGTLYPILKLLLISFIIIYFLSNKNLKSMVIVISMFCFLLADIAQISQFLFFMIKNVRALAILDVSFYIIGVYLLHQYFIRPEHDYLLFD